jgi:vacuolar-type H+-ATPase subunit E/Vma4
MAIEDILRALDEQAQADCDAVINEAREHGKLIMDEAEREAQQIHEGFVRQVERVATGEAAKRVNAARLEAKMTVSSVKGNAVSEVFDTATERLSTLRDSPGYDALFAALADEALGGLQGPVTIRVAASDAARAQQVAASRGDTTVDAALSTAGGLVVEAKGGHVVRRNTLEDRLDRSRTLVQADVARVLFS